MPVLADLFATSYSDSFLQHCLNEVFAAPPSTVFELDAGSGLPSRALHQIPTAQTLEPWDIGSVAHTNTSFDTLFNDEMIATLHHVNSRASAVHRRLVSTLETAEQEMHSCCIRRCVPCGLAAPVLRRIEASVKATWNHALTAVYALLEEAHQACRLKKCNAQPSSVMGWGASCVLLRWYVRHFTFPFPSEDDKQMFELQTRLSRKRIDAFFINKRHRRKKRAAKWLTESRPAFAPSLLSADPASVWGGLHGVLTRLATSD